MLTALTAAVLTGLTAAAAVTATGVAWAGLPSASAASAPSSAVSTPPAFAARVPAATAQVLRTVRTRQWCPQVWCTRTEAWTKVAGRWSIVRQADGRPAVFRSTIGPSGFAGPRGHREGDGTTPSGVFSVTVTFSTTPTNPGTMPWRRRLPTSMVANFNNRLYNTWIEQPGRTDGSRPAMRYGLWMAYNRPRLVAGVGPKPIPGRGSGIFVHTAPTGRTWKPTKGCTQIGRVADMRWVLGWLAPQAIPRVVENL